MTVKYDNGVLLYTNFFLVLNLYPDNSEKEVCQGYDALALVDVAKLIHFWKEHRGRVRFH